MSEISLRDQYLGLIDDIIETTLKGKISSVEQVYQMLLKGITAGTGEIFELVLSERLTDLQTQVEQEKDDLKKAKVTRSLRAIKTIETQWQRWQEQNKVTEVIAGYIKEITTVKPGEYLTVLCQIIDPNQKYPLNLSQLQQLAKNLQQFAIDKQELREISQGIIQGITSWQRIQENLLSWMYEQKSSLGFGGVASEKGLGQVGVN